MALLKTRILITPAGMIGTSGQAPPPPSIGSIISPMQPIAVQTTVVQPNNNSPIKVT